MAPDPDPSADPFADQRAALLEAVEGEIARYGLGGEADGERALDARVSAAMRRVRREQFMPEKLWPVAYENRPLPIGHGQTISQPLIVAVMTHVLRLTPRARVLEIGTGSGYQAAILAELAAELVTIEIVPALAERAQAKLAALGYRNIACHEGDGAAGWPERAPYDGIIVTAAAPSIPPALLDQLADGGRLVAPVGADSLSQDLILVEKDAGGLHQHRLFPVAFVPLTGERPAQ